MSSRVKALFTLLFWTQLTWLLVDSASGYLLHTGITPESGLSLGAAFRSGVLLLLLAIAFLSPHADRRLPAFLVAFVVVFTVAHFWAGRTEPDIAQKALRLTLAPLFYVAMQAQIAAGELGPRRLAMIVSVNVAVLLGNLYLTFFGLGFSQYGVTEDGLFKGGAGFFYAGNDTGGAMIALLSLSLALTLRRSAAAYLLIAVAFIAGAIGLLSKTALAGTILILGVALLLTRPQLGFATVAVVTIGLLALFELYWPYIELAVGRWRYLAGEFGVLTYAIGGAKRIGYIAEYLQTVAADPLLLLVGTGWTGFAENNVFDLLEAFGIWGLVFYAIWMLWAVNLRRAVRRLRPHREFVVALAGMVLLLGVSATAGHILQSAMLAPFVALLACLPRILVAHGVAVPRRLPPRQAGAGLEAAPDAAGP